MGGSCRLHMVVFAFGFGSDPGICDIVHVSRSSFCSLCGSTVRLLALETPCHYVRLSPRICMFLPVGSAWDRRRTERLQWGPWVIRQAVCASEVWALLYRELDEKHVRV